MIKNLIEVNKNGGNCETPILAEIDETLNMCHKDLLKKITKKTKAVIVVHMLGVPANLDKIKAICSRYKIKLIEDTAW